MSLICETNSPATARRVLRAARACLGRRKLDATFEHGQWWVSHQPSGAQWAANDGTGEGTYDGLCFEQVTQGDDA